MKVPIGNAFKAQAEEYKKWIICPLCHSNENIEITSIVRDKQIQTPFKQDLSIQSRCKKDHVDINIEYLYYPETVTPIGGKTKTIRKTLFKGH